MKSSGNPRSHITVFALIVVFMLSCSDAWTHAAAPATFTSNLLLASEGGLDPSFGTGGKLTTGFFNHMDLATDLALQPDGRIIVVGRITGRTDNDKPSRYVFITMRYNSDGSIDNSFGKGGNVTTDFSGYPAWATAVALYPDGRIVVAGDVDHDSDGNSNFGIARYNSDGSLDTTFGSDGKVITGFNSLELDNGVHDVAVQKDGKILVAGFVSRGGTSWDFGLVRYNINGSLDTSFGTNGKVTTDFFREADDPLSLVLQPDGKIIVAGDIVNVPEDTNHDFGLARYNSNGTLDASFGSGGKVTTDFFRISDSAQAVVLQPNGKIIAAGYVYSGDTDYDFALVRYNSNGSLDRSFGTNGKIVTDFFEGRDEVNALSLQPDGKIIAGGYASTSPSPDFTRSFVALARYSSDGSGLDSSFGVNGKMTINFFGQRDKATALAMQPDGKLVVAGCAQQNEDNYDIALLRLLAFTPPDFALRLNAATAQASRGKEANVNIEIERVGGFTGNVTVNVSDTSAFGITVTPNPISTTGSKVKFNLKVKSSALVGTRQVTFTGRDNTGRKRIATLDLIVQ